MANFNGLSFSDVDYNSSYQYISQNAQCAPASCPPAQQASQQLQKCMFNCVCCARLSFGTVCSCNHPKATASTQTNSFEFPQENLNADNIWKKGSFEHGLVQKLIVSTLEKFSYTSVRCRSTLSSVTEEVQMFLSQKFCGYVADMKRLKGRIQKAAQWKRFYDKKREEATSSKTSAWAILKRKRGNPNKENQMLLEETEEIGIDNRGFQDSDSDSDVPLAELKKRK